MHKLCTGLLSFMDGCFCSGGCSAVKCLFHIKMRFAIAKLLLGQTCPVFSVQCWFGLKYGSHVICITECGSLTRFSHFDYPFKCSLFKVGLVSSIVHM